MSDPLNHERNLLKLDFKSDYVHGSFKITEFLILLALACSWKKVVFKDISSEIFKEI